MVDPNHPRISIVRQCRLVSIARSSFYYAGPKAKTRRSHKSCRSLPPKTRRNPQQVAERLHAADPRWGRRINSTGPISDDTVAYRVGTSPQHRYRTRRPYHPRPAPVAHLRSLGGDAGGASHYIPAYLGISRHISDPFFCSRAPRRRRGARSFTLSGHSGRRGCREQRGLCFTLMERDFDNPATGVKWPITSADLVPYYRRAMTDVLERDAATVEAEWPWCPGFVWRPASKEEPTRFGLKYFEVLESSPTIHVALGSSRVGPRAGVSGVRLRSDDERAISGTWRHRVQSERRVVWRCGARYSGDHSRARRCASPRSSRVSASAILSRLSAICSRCSPVDCAAAKLNHICAETVILRDAEANFVHLPEEGLCPGEPLLGSQPYQALGFGVILRDAFAPAVR